MTILQLYDSSRLCNKPPPQVYFQRYSKPSPQEYLAHHGVEGQKWGVRRGPPYPLTPEQKKDSSGGSEDDKVAKSSKPAKIGKEVLDEAIRKREVSLKLNFGHQKKHLPDREDKRRSYIRGTLADAQQLILKLSGTGELISSPKGWTHKERVVAPDKVGVYITKRGTEIQTKNLLIHYGRKGSHIMAAQEEEE